MLGVDTLSTPNQVHPHGARSAVLGAQAASGSGDHADSYGGREKTGIDKEKMGERRARVTAFSSEIWGEDGVWGVLLLLCRTPSSGSKATQGIPAHP